MKDRYDNVEIEVIGFEAEDVIVTSCTGVFPIQQDCESYT